MSEPQTGVKQSFLSIGSSEHRAAIRVYAARIATSLERERPGLRLLALWAALLAALAMLSVLAASTDHFTWDVTITRAVQAIQLPGLQRLAWVATFFSSPTISLLGLSTVVGLLLLTQRPRLAIFAGISAWTHLLGGFLKLVVDRPRPSPELVDVVRIETKFSFPSGHAEWVMGFEGFLVFAVWQLTENRAMRIGSLAIWSLHLVFAGLGRVEQGLHWPSDLLAGYLVGAIALSVTIWAYRVSARLSPRPGAIAPAVMRPPSRLGVG